MEALRAYRPSSSMKTITIIIPTIFLILLINHRRIVGWLIYHAEYISAVKGENLIGDSCKYILKEQNLWKRTEYNADWFMRSRCDANLAVETYNYQSNFPPMIEVSNTFSWIFDLGRTNFAKLFSGVTTHVISAASSLEANSILTVDYIKALGLFIFSVLGSWIAAAPFNIGSFVAYYLEVYRTTTYTFSMTRSYLDLTGWGIFLILFILQYNQHERLPPPLFLQPDFNIRWFDWLISPLRSIVTNYRQRRFSEVFKDHILQNILWVLYQGLSPTKYIITTPFKIYLICTWSASSYDTKRAQIMTRLIWCFLYAWSVLFLYLGYNFGWFSFVVSTVWPAVFSAVDWVLNAPSYNLFQSWVVLRYMHHICTGNGAFARKAAQLSSFVQYLTNSFSNNVNRFFSFVGSSYSFQMVAPLFVFVWYMYIYWANYQFMDATRLLQSVWYSIKSPVQIATPFFVFVWYVYWLNYRFMEVTRFLESRFMKVTRFLKLIWDSINSPLMGGSTSQPAVARNNNFLVYIADSLLQLLYSYLLCQWILDFDVVPMSLALPGFLFYTFCHTLLNWSFNALFRINTHSALWFLVKIIQEIATISLYCAISQFVRYEQVSNGMELLQRILCEEAIAGDYGSIHANILHRIPLCTYTIVRLILKAAEPLAINFWIDAVRQSTWISYTINKCNITNDPSKALLLPALFIALFSYETAISTRLQDIFFLATSTLSVLLLSMKEFREPRTRKNMVPSESEPYAYDCIPVGPSPPFRPFWALAILNTFVALLVFVVPGGEERYSIAALERTWNSTSNLAIYVFGFTFIVYLAMRLIPGELLVRAHANLPNRPRKRNGYPAYYVDWYTAVRTFFDDEDVRIKTVEKTRAFLSEGPLNFPVAILKLQFLLVATLLGQLLAPGIISLTVILAIWLVMKFGVVGHLACNFDILILNYDDFAYSFEESSEADLQRGLEAARGGIEAAAYEVRNTEEGIAEEDTEPLPSSSAQSEEDGESVSDNSALSTSSEGQEDQKALPPAVQSQKPQPISPPLSQDVQRERESGIQEQPNDVEVLQPACPKILGSQVPLPDSPPANPSQFPLEDSPITSPVELE